MKILRNLVHRVIVVCLFCIILSLHGDYMKSFHSKINILFSVFLLHVAFLGFYDYVLYNIMTIINIKCAFTNYFMN